MTDHLLYSSSEEQADNLDIAGRALSCLITSIQTLYLEDRRPWVIGFSGGKDSTAVVQLVYFSVKTLRASERKKPVYVVSSNTLVETPLVLDLLMSTQTKINETSASESIPLEAHTVTPNSDQTFWVNLLGKGYPAPTRNFRWCTERMKINPISSFVLDRVADFGEVVMVLGARTEESASRSQVMAKHRIKGTSLARHTSLPNAYVYTPIEDWTSDEVWEYLMSAPCPWGGSNQKLFELYKGSNEGECPIVIDTKTPSCGNSRFGCWTCTVVSKDRAVESLIAQGESWMKPLLDFRNMLSMTTQPEHKAKYRNVRRRGGQISIMRDQLQSDGNGEKAQKKSVPGPYWMRFRQQWLEQLLRIQKDYQDQGRVVELIGDDELHQIRKEWLNDPIEPDQKDSLPIIYRRVCGTDLDWVQNDAVATNRVDNDLIVRLEEQFEVPKYLLHKLLELEIEKEGLIKRRGVQQGIGKILSQDWGTVAEAIERDRLIRDGGFAEEVEQMKSELEQLEKTTL